MSEQNDLISRQAAIDALRRLRGNWNNADNAVDKCISTIDLLPPAQPQRCMNTIRRSDAIDALIKAYTYIDPMSFTDVIMGVEDAPAQPQRDIPKKPNETIDRSWGISTRQAICPNCDAYLGMVHFICESDKKKVTYCESCGQAIDWTDWEDGE